MSLESAPTAARAPFAISILGGFALREREQLVPPLASEAQHLLALLALRDQAVPRVAIAGTLWPEASEAHAFASLRSALSRLGTFRKALAVDAASLVLAEDVAIDLREARVVAYTLLDPLLPLPESSGMTSVIVTLSTDCLPDWYEDWAIVESEQWRQLRLHALDALALRLTAEHRFGEAVQAALSCTRAEPLRESGWAVLIRAHLAEGNQSEAIRAFEQFRTMLEEELHIDPTPALRALLPRIIGT